MFGILRGQYIICNLGQEIGDVMFELRYEVFRKGLELVLKEIVYDVFLNMFVSLIRWELNVMELLNWRKGG